MIQALIPQLLPILGKVLDDVVPDSKAKEQALSKMKSALIDNQHSLGLETIKTNQVEEAHRSVWVAGWRGRWPGLQFNRDTCGSWPRWGKHNCDQ